ncbi:unnamed protein product [Cladocopium goreaui]|uniref:E3 ISG15--protein ligase HERC5 n=1 Tax=Cladocopium goreaui TaxID=2562237 RepID=A0A9P1C7U9_9DINO|nr:unnamed protein product [Cladocopium goreaui]
MAVVDVLIWRRAAAPGGQRPTPELFQPVVPLSFAQCGGSLLAFVTVDNKLYLMDSTSTSSPRLVEGLAEHAVIQVACSPQGFLVAITAAGAAYQVTSPAGLQERAEAGDPKAMVLLSSGMLATFGRLQELPLPVSVVSCACGAQHMLLLSGEGLVFAQGTGPQLGLGEVQQATSPVCIQALSHVQVSHIAAGTKHSLAVTSFGNLFSWGQNHQGQLGDGSVMPRDTPGLLGEVLGAVCAAAQQASAAIAKDGQIFAWGFAGQMLPRAMSLGRRAKALALTEELLVCCSTTGELIFMELVKDEAWIAHDKVLHVSASDHHVVALCASTRAAGAEQVHQPAVGTSTLEPSDSRGPLSESQLWAAKERLERSLQELQAEHFLELCGLRSQVSEADERLVKMGVQLSEQQLQSSRQKEEEDLAHLRQELEITRAALTAEAEDLATFSGSEVPALQAAQSRLRLTQETLQETQRTLERRDAALKEEVKEMESQLATLSARCHRVDEACRVAQKVVDQSQAHSVERRRCRKERLKEECQEMEQMQMQLETELEGQQLEEQRLALQQRVLQLQRSRDNARRKVMEQLRAKEQSLLQDVNAFCSRAEEWRRLLQSQESEEEMLQQELKSQAARFAETAMPLYAQVERLHSQLGRQMCQ